jgi:SAM-dependent methyltransferase
MSSSDAASQFYTGLVAELYEPLASQPTRADDYTLFLEHSGTPALELACGSGVPLVELIERGYEVEGLDASQDMLDRCHARAAARGLDATLHLAEMQSFSIPRRYKSIFLAGASFTLLTSDEDASRTLERIHAHLDPGGSALIPLEIADVETIRGSLGRVREVVTATGECLRIARVGLDVSVDERSLRHRMRYERVVADREHDVVERDWQTRWWPQSQFRDMLHAARFQDVTFLTLEGGPAPQDAAIFVALARRI